MKTNEIKLKLIKVDGINAFLGKGIYDTETLLCTEKSGGFILKKHKSIYAISSDHIKRGNKGKAYCFVDLGTHQSVGDIKTDGTSISFETKKNIKLINQIQYVTQKANWEAQQKKLKMSIWAQLTLIFAGIGIFFLITSIIRSLGVMF